METARRHLSFANVVSVLALFVALGGTAWGVAHLPKNSVGSKQIRNGAVKKVDLHKKAVTYAKLAPNSIDSSKVRDGSLGASDVNNTIQLALTSPCPAGQAISSITQQGAPNCALIPGSVSLGALTAQVNALAGQVAALCGAIRTAAQNNFSTLSGAALPVTGTLPAPIGSVAGLLSAGAPSLGSLPSCPP
jgi:hypothetical protein